MLERAWLWPLKWLWFGLMGSWLVLLTIVIKPIAYLLSTPFRPIITIVNLVCHWAGETPSSKWGMVLVGSFCISFLTLIPFVGARVEIALSFLFSLFIHELLHGYGYFRAKVPFYIVFIGFLGAAAVTSDTNYNKMKHWDKSIMLLLGPVGSLLVAVFWWVLSFIDPSNVSTYMMLAGFNLTLVLFNMIALGGLDGGRIYLSMMASLREDREKYVAITMVVISIIVLVHAFLQSFRFELIIFFLLLMVIGFVKTIGKDNPTDYLREPAMKTGKVLVVMMMYLSLFTVSAIIYPLFPDWSPLVVVHPFIGAHLPEIVMFLVIVGLWVMATDLSHWGLAHKKYKPAVELLVVFLLLGVPLITSLNAFESGISVEALLFIIAGSGLIGNFSMRALMKWKKIHDEVMAKRPVEPQLDVFEVVGDIA